METCWESPFSVNGLNFGLSCIQKTFLWSYQSLQDLQAAEHVKQGRHPRMNARFPARQNIHISTLTEISVYQDDSNIHIDLFAKLQMVHFYIIR